MEEKIKAAPGSYETTKKFQCPNLKKITYRFGTYSI